jgi:hypothetical protein
LATEVPRASELDTLEARFIAGELQTLLGKRLRMAGEHEVASILGVQGDTELLESGLKEID